VIYCVAEVQEAFAEGIYCNAGILWSKLNPAQSTDIIGCLM